MDTLDDKRRLRFKLGASVLSHLLHTVKSLVALTRCRNRCNAASDIDEAGSLARGRGTVVGGASTSPFGALSSASLAETLPGNADAPEVCVVQADVHGPRSGPRRRWSPVVQEAILLSLAHAGVVSLQSGAGPSLTRRATGRAAHRAALAACGPLVRAQTSQSAVERLASCPPAHAPVSRSARARSQRFAPSSSSPRRFAMLFASLSTGSRHRATHHACSCLCRCARRRNRQIVEPTVRPRPRLAGEGASPIKHWRLALVARRNRHRKLPAVRRSLSSLIRQGDLRVGVDERS